MGQPAHRFSGHRDVSISSATIVTAIVVAALYWGQTVFVPILLATLLVFVLQPAVRFLERVGLGRAASVVITVSAITFLSSWIFWLVMSEAYGLLDKLPEYTGNITEKVQSLKHFGGESTLKKLDFMIAEISRAWNGEHVWTSEPPETRAGPAVVKPIVPAVLSYTVWLVGSALEGALSSAFALVLAFFALLRREAIRNRLLRLAGGRLAVATKALDEAGSRIGCYLRTQLLVNASFGAVWGAGLYFLGVDYPLLWGVLGGMLRYIPYVGPVLAGFFPLTLSVAASPEWTQPIGVLCLYLALEFAINSLVEPWLYGQSLGISEVALLVSAAFWAMMWGPIGLILAGPLTVCLAVIGRHVHQFRFLALLLGDEQVLAPHSSLYQRLLARDQDEASQLALTQAKRLKEKTYDELLIPCLNLLKVDRQNNYASEEQEHFIIESLQEIIEELDHANVCADSTVTTQDATVRTKAGATKQVRLLAYPARDLEDKLALQMLQSLLDPAQWRIEIVSLDTLTSELVDRVADKSAPLVRIGALPPGGLAHTRYVCKRLRARYPSVKIAVGRWASKFDGESDLDALAGIGADLIATTLLETRDQLQTWLPVLIEEEKVAAVV